MEGGKPDRPLAARDRPFAGIMEGGVEYTEPKQSQYCSWCTEPIWKFTQLQKRYKMEDLLYSISSQVDLFLQHETTEKVSLMCRTCEHPKQIFLGAKHEAYVCEKDYEFFAGVLKGEISYDRHKHCSVIISYLEDEISYEMATEECPDYWFIQSREDE